ncbi:polysaccharide pyruvyl transferase family protein [Agromyces sp. SYSU T00266]|uniref:polysaccharide pyruvyl transferase family protein n=1 Tax=Agromyces zhanjiangensis TaxID=3158562 RepID=UPI003399C7BB
MPHVLTIGAYERDNFGDILFYRLTADYLAEAGFDVTAGSILTADLPGAEPVRVRPWHELLDERTWDAVWVVGGEIGGVDVLGALGMSLPEHERKIFAEASAPGRAFVARFLGQADPHAMAYLPELMDYPLNRDTPLVANSIGVSRLGILDDANARDRSSRALLAARRVSVRDDDSKSVIESFGGNAELAPDMVHAIAGRPGYGRNELSVEREVPFALVQVNTELVRKFGVDAFASAIARLSADLNLDIVLFAAGTAYAHDSFADYVRIASAARGRTGRRVEILTTRDTSTLVAHIAHATLWVGSSLHGRIISSSYGVPRVSLENDKVSRYAGAWDPDSPHGVTPDDMLEASARAIALAADPEEHSRSRSLRERADRSTMTMIGALG